MTNPSSQNYWEELSLELPAAQDFENKLECLRRFTRSSNRALRDRDLSGTVSLSELFAGLTAVAEAVVRGARDITQKEIFRNSPPLAGDFAVIAMGKFGGREITYYSDLDIIFLYEDSSDQERATRLCQRMISALALVTREGTAYQIDTALRPSGNRGTLVSTLESFREYHRTMGKTWEKQSLVRARPLFGGKTFLQKIRSAFTETSYQRYSPKDIAEEIHGLRLRIEKELARERSGYFNLKTGRGGLIDIEFATQYLQLIHGLDHPEIRSTNTLEALQALEHSSLLESALAKNLRDAYLFYRELETRIRLVLERSSDELIVGKDWLKAVEERFFAGESVVERYLDLRETVRGHYLNILGVTL